MTSDDKKTTGATESPKGFFARILEKLDRKLEKKAQETKCCGGSKDGKKGSPCC